MGGANLRGYVVGTPAQAQDAKRQGQWPLDPRHLPMNTSQGIEEAGGRPGAHEEAAEPAAGAAISRSRSPSACQLQSQKIPTHVRRLWRGSRIQWWWGEWSSPR